MFKVGLRFLTLSAGEDVAPPTFTEGLRTTDGARPLEGEALGDGEEEEEEVVPLPPFFRTICSTMGLIFG